MSAATTEHVEGDVDIPAPANGARHEKPLTEGPKESANQKTFREAAHKVLAQAVKNATGIPNAEPRPGQVMMLDDILDATTVARLMSSDGDGLGPSGAPVGGGQMSGIGPTGVGKSATYLSVAAVAAATGNGRSIISTESLALQSQIAVKDAPAVVEACKTVTGVAPAFAILKGFGNYVCVAQALNSANELLIMAGKPSDGSPRGAVAKLAKAKPADPKIGRSIALLKWALEQGMSEQAVGDKDSYDEMFSAADWAAVSVSSDECVGEQKCPFAEQCLPRRAIKKTAEADVVVTNHTLLGIQAAHGIPVVIGSKRVGNFDHVFVDEAHGLPSIVRQQGAVEVSGKSITRLAKRIERTLDSNDNAVDALLVSSQIVAKEVEDALAPFDPEKQHTGGRGQQDSVRGLVDGDEPFEECLPLVKSWLKEAAKLLAQARKNADGSPTAQVKIKRVENGVGSLAKALDETSVHQVGFARWVEREVPDFGHQQHAKAGAGKGGGNEESHLVVRGTPLDVASRIHDNLWSAEIKDDSEDSDNGSGGGRSDDFDEDGLSEGSSQSFKPRIPLTAVCLSATLPSRFNREAGLFAARPPKTYPSPYDVAYANSSLFVPAPDVAALRRENRWSDNSGKPQFDTRRHTEWAKTLIIDLVRANGGSALVLAATADAGRQYADALRMAANMGVGLGAPGGKSPKIYSQWDGIPIGRLKDEWRADLSGVLVGTKSFMTGVDAPGESLTLVIIDRIPRSPENPVDEARVTQILASMEAAGQRIDRWAGRRMVYVEDASLLLEQAAGRLIRSSSDSGMVAVLDPRLLGNQRLANGAMSNPFAYQDNDRRVYLDALHRFPIPNRHTSLEAAKNWLKGRKR